MRLSSGKVRSAESRSQLAASVALTSRGMGAPGRLVPGIRYAGSVGVGNRCLATHPSPGYLCMVVGGTGDRTHFPAMFKER